MRSTVIGAGELGTACALALLAGCKVKGSTTAGASPVILKSRDPSLLFSTARGSGPAKAERCFSVFEPQHHLAIPPELSLESYGSPPAADTDMLHVCVPTRSLELEAAAISSDAESHFRRFLREYGARRATSSAAACPPVVTVFSREWSSNGMTPLEATAALLAGNGPAVSDASGETDPPLVLVACGPLLPREWALSSTAAPPSGRRPYSGTAITFAAATPAAAIEPALLDSVEARLAEHFARESVTLLRDPGAADVLAVTNACLPLCAFGAGLVSNAYAGSATAPLASYTQHAMQATAALITDMLAGGAVEDEHSGPSEDAAGKKPLLLPPVVYAAVAFACSNFASREFNVGRKLDFHFRRQDVAKSLFAGDGYERFVGNIEGLYTRMQAAGVQSPFFEVLMDTFSTMLRASTTGEGLVRIGHYDYRDPPPSPLLQHMLRVDQAMLRDSEADFERAKQDLVDAFPHLHSAIGPEPLR